MSDVLTQLILFAAELFIFLIFILILLISILAITAKSKQQGKGTLKIKPLNIQYEEAALSILMHTASKQELKSYLKTQKQKRKEQAKLTTAPKCIYILNFIGDLQASAVNSLRHEINAILSIIRPQDEVVLKLESPGGVVHGYGLAAAQLARLREKNIPLTVIIDKVAASGGYMMACVAHHILAAPFAIIGSIGVVMQMPNFNRFLKSKNIDFEQQTAGEYKRTLTIFGENTDEARAKIRDELEHIHHQFKDLITTYRDVELAKVATGEHWLAKEALDLKLIDGLTTSDSYLLEKSKDATLFEISYEVKKPLLAKLMGNVSMHLQKLNLRSYI